MSRNDILNRKDDILNWVAQSLPKAYICRELSCKPGTLETYLKKLNIEYSGNKGRKGLNRGNLVPIEEYLKKDGKFITSHQLKIKLIKNGLKAHMCEKCKLSEWMGRPIPIELHHKDGNHSNNELSNLEILCPNCHAQTDNNSGAANKSKR